MGNNQPIVTPIIRFAATSVFLHMLSRAPLGWLHHLPHQPVAAWVMLKMVSPLKFTPSYHRLTLHDLSWASFVPKGHLLPRRQRRLHGRTVGNAFQWNSTSNHSPQIARHKSCLSNCLQFANQTLFHKICQEKQSCFESKSTSGLPCQISHETAARISLQTLVPNVIQEWTPPSNPASSKCKMPQQSKLSFAKLTSFTMIDACKTPGSNGLKHNSNLYFPKIPTQTCQGRTTLCVDTRGNKQWQGLSRPHFFTQPSPRLLSPFYSYKFGSCCKTLTFFC